MDTMLEIAKRVDAFMMERSPVHGTMRRLAEAFSDLEIPFAIAGAMAANAHGHRRTTADVNVLVRREDLVRFKGCWIGRGWVDLFEGSKGFKDTLNGVKVDVLIVGDYPGDGQPKPVSFPTPESVRGVLVGQALLACLEGVIASVIDLVLRSHLRVGGISVGCDSCRPNRGDRRHQNSTHPS